MSSDDAVSPVVATILLVAIVVVLAAVISATVIPMAGNIGTVKSVSAVVTLNDAGTLPVVTVVGGTDAESVEKLTVYVSGTKDAVISVSNPLVGKQTVSIVASFDDGTVQTLYTGSLVFKGSAVSSLAE